MTGLLVALSRARRLAGDPGEDRAAKVGNDYLDDARWGGGTRSISILAFRADEALMVSGGGGGELRGTLRTADEALLRRALGLQIVAARILICLKNRDVREVKMSHCFNFKAACEQLENYAASAIPKAHKSKMSSERASERPTQHSRGQHCHLEAEPGESVPGFKSAPAFLRRGGALATWTRSRSEKKFLRSSSPGGHSVTTSP